MKAKIVLCFLQNAYRRDHDGRRWARRDWLGALHRSRSGTRLRVLIASAGESIELRFENASPKIGDHPDSIFAPDAEHIARRIKTINPAAIVTLGASAALIVPDLAGSIPGVALPHPAFRVVTNECYRRGGALLRRRLGAGSRTIVRQLRGSVEIERR